MKKLDIESLLLEYISGKGDPDQQKRLESILLNHGYNMTDLKELNDIYINMDKIPVPDPGQEMSENFYTMLRTYLDEITFNKSLFEKSIACIKSLNRPKFIPSIAYGLLLMLTGWLIGFWSSGNSGYKEELNYLNSEIHELKTMMTINMLDQDSPAARIKTINQINNLDNI